MSEWWTYSLSSFLLFSPRTYHRLFELYNAAMWPAQIAALAFGGAALWLVAAPRAWSGRAIAAMLALAWAWVAWGFMLQRYAAINWAAEYMAWGFALQALLLLWLGVIRNRLDFAPPRRAAARIGFAVAALAVIAYPLLAPALGRPWRQAELFGMAPDPTAIATLGIVLAAARGGWALIALPLGWCVAGGLTLLAMKSPEAPVPFAAAGLTIVLAWAKRR